jgi:hypothetical protein
MKTKPRDEGVAKPFSRVVKTVLYSRRKDSVLKGLSSRCRGDWEASQHIVITRMRLQPKRHKQRLPPMETRPSIVVQRYLQTFKPTQSFLRPLQ